MAAAVDGEESLRLLNAADPPQYLSPSGELSRHARDASRYLYSALFNSCPKPKPPLSELLVDESFDAEQIWCQIDLVSRPVVSMLRREIRRIERDPPRPAAAPAEEEQVKEEEEEDDGDEEEEEGGDEEEGDEEEGSDDEEEEEEKEGNGVEDRFLKIKELEEYLEDDEEREFGEVKDKHRKKKLEEDEEDDDDEDDEEGEDEDEEEDEEGEVDLQVKVAAFRFFF